jgi:transposase InsO family protein
VAHLKKLIATEPVTEGPLRRGFLGQRADRANERVIREHVVAVSQRLVEQGWTWSATAGLLRVPDRTLRDWRAGLAGPRLLDVVPLGRPAYLAPPAQRNLVIRRIDELGPAIGVPRLRNEFPHLPRVEIANLLDRFRRLWRRRHREALMALDWSRPGAVWAIDFHGPRAQPVDGCFAHLLAVRDLASGQVLLWRPVADATARTTVAALQPLFVVHGAPLVLKSDNGSAFIAEPLRKLCDNFGVKILYSPPHTPSYNGSIEATIGSLKTRTEQHAALHGHPGHWTTADTDAARRQANAVAQPHGPSPDQAWNTRPMIAPAQRHDFFEAATRRFESLAQAQAEPQDTDAQRRATDRDAISQVLVELGYLSITRGRYRLPVPKKKVAKTT